MLTGNRCFSTLAALVLALSLCALDRQAVSGDEIDMVLYSQYLSQPWRTDPPAYLWTLGELWWYGQAKLFAQGTEVSYQAEDTTAFLVRGRLTGSSSKGLFGVSFQWDKPLVKGLMLANGDMNAWYQYRFSLRMRSWNTVPDLITVNNHVVWTKEKNGLVKNEFIEFTYVPRNLYETATINLIAWADNTWRTIEPVTKSQPNLTCTRQITTTYPQYEQFLLPSDTQWISQRPDHTLGLFHDTYLQPVKYQPTPLPALPYPNSDVTVLERLNIRNSNESVIRGYVSAATEAGAFVPKQDFLTYQPGVASFDSWAKAATESGVHNLLLTPLVEQAPGRYAFNHLHAVMGELNKLPPDQRLKGIFRVADNSAAVVRRWLDLVPDGQAYLFLVEVNGAFGVYPGEEGIAKAKIGNLPGYEGIRNGGAQAWFLAFDFFNKYIARVREQLGKDGERLKVVANFDRAAFQGAYGYLLGADVILHKNIHRQSFNVVVANSRGAGRAYGKEYGFDFDAWDRNYWYGYGADEVRQGLLVYYHAGAQYLMDELPVWSGAGLPLANATGLNTYGQTWLEFLRYVRTHPSRGEQQVRIAVMRALGDEWNRVAGASSSWESAEWMPTAELNAALRQKPVSPKWAKAEQATNEHRTVRSTDTYLADYNLLNLLFADFGSPWRTNPDRQFTGTPYGPVDFIPWNTPVQKLQGYDVVIFLGNGVVEPETVGNLEQFVESGGTLFVAAGQLRGADNQLAAAQFLGVKLGSTKVAPDNGLPYTVLQAGPAGEVVQRFSNGDPMVVKVTAGSGVGYLFSGEWLTYYDNAVAPQLLKPALERVKWLEFTNTDRLEYMVRKKAGTWIFPIFNHGRGFSPSGNGIDHGPWQGNISINLRNLGLDPQDLAVYQAVYTPDSAVPFQLEPVAYQISGDQIALSLTINDLAEVVIGPRQSVTNDFFY